MSRVFIDIVSFVLSNYWQYYYIIAPHDVRICQTTQSQTFSSSPSFSHADKIARVLTLCIMEILMFPHFEFLFFLQKGFKYFASNIKVETLRSISEFSSEDSFKAYNSKKN